MSVLVEGEGEGEGDGYSHSRVGVRVRVTLLIEGELREAGEGWLCAMRRCG